ncbi:MAG: DUF4405 domain-containing protein [Bacteroidales bacterium]|jgi:magnesium-transporting ATPase (P-type)|nr:DUF4405 domain-containing protein [Bacteroidales bacterium]
MAREKENEISKNTLNLILDTILLFLMLLMAGIGFLMRYTLLSGEERVAVYGRNVDLEFLGLTRHQWGDLHLIVSITFLSLLLLHIILHWTCIECFFRKKIPSRPLRTTLTVIAVIIILMSLLGPFFLRPQQVPFQPQYRNRQFYNYNQNGRTGGFPAINSTNLTAGIHPALNYYKSTIRTDYNFKEIL